MQLFTQKGNNNKTARHWLNLPETAEGEGREAFYSNEPPQLT